MMKVFDTKLLDSLTLQARIGTRLRQHLNIHQSFSDPCQRLFNAIEPGSYIRPHRHKSDPKDEMLVAVRGLMALVAFDDHGKVLSVTPFGCELSGADLSVAVEVPATVWHTVISLKPGSILLEIKAGPFDPKQPKDLASWAPEEGSDLAGQFLSELTAVAISSYG